MKDGKIWGVPSPTHRDQRILLDRIEELSLALKDFLSMVPDDIDMVHDLPIFKLRAVLRARRPAPEERC